MKNNMTDYQKFIHISRYARYNYDEERRETWEETVERYIDNIVKPAIYKDPQTDGFLVGELRDAILNLEVLPSMRSLMTAGPALERCHVAGYNCLMCGTGVGFSVEEQYVTLLPTVNEHFEPSDTVIKVADSKAGWARALRELIALLYSGQQPKWDTGGVRPAGARLKTFGGRASGPGPLEELFGFVCETFKRASGRRLTSLECHDIMC